jgi:hypothetical protein
LPVTINSSAPSHSFRLTGDLVTASGNQTMISVSVPSVTLDLGGFRIGGPNACNGVPVASCTTPGSGIGVTGGNDVTVKNGSIAGMGGAAVNLTYSARIENLSIFHCGAGIIATDLAVIRGNIVTSTGGDGIGCRDHCVVTENTATGHFADGIDVRNGTVNGNTASLNGGSGGHFVGRVAFAQNQFSENGVGDVSGGHASGGNSCADATCGERGQRRYYLTKTTHNGSQATGACAVGFHFASLWEIYDPSVLEYDFMQGKTENDSGQGPTGVNGGWIRTGAASASSSGPVGFLNCNAWTTSLGSGSYAELHPGAGWDSEPATRSGPWSTEARSCGLPLFVWCVED